MTIKHHPDVATLMSYAAGSLAEPLAAVVASHASLCPACRREIAAMERLGASLLFDTLSPTTMNAPPPDVRAPVAACAHDLGETTPTSSGDVPAPLVRLVGADLDQLPWKRLGYGIWHLPLPLSEGVKGDLRLFKVAPGMVMPEHGHGGAEMMLMLKGSYKDEFGHFTSGDIADLDEDAEHQPVADPEEGCICLIASTEKAKFKSLLARIVQPFTGL